MLSLRRGAFLQLDYTLMFSHGEPTIALPMCAGRAVASIAVVIWACGLAAAQDSKLLKSIELCNGAERSTQGAQIAGCTALIDSKATTSVGQSIAYNNRGHAYSSEAKYDLAIADYDRSITLNPRFAKAYNNRGVAYARQGNMERALQNFEAAIELDHNYTNAYINRADLYLKQRKYELAARDYDVAIGLNRTNKNAWSGRCWARAQLGQLHNALNDCDEAVRSGPEPNALEARGLVYLKMKVWDAAISDYDAALKIDPKRPVALYGRGLSKAQKGDKAGAEADMTAARQIDPGVSAGFKSAGLD